MDDRDFIYWLQGIFEFGNFDVLKSEQIDSIIENVCDVYENFHNNGIVADFDSMRIISFVEGALMYYDDASIEHKIKVTKLIRNEVEEICRRLRDKSEIKTPLVKYSTMEKFIPKDKHLVTKMLSKEETKEILDIFSNVFGKDKKKKDPYYKDEGSQRDQKQDPTQEEYWFLHKELFEDGNADEFSGESDGEANSDMMESSLDAIAEKISARG